MRIAQISTLATPVRPKGAGSIEGHVYLLTRELTRMGHQVTVFAAGGSDVGADAELVETLPGEYGVNGAPDDWRTCELINLCRAVEQAERFDVIHSHNYLWGVPFDELSVAPVVHTLHVAPSDDDARLVGMYGGACVAAISKWQWSEYPSVTPHAVVHHGVNPRQFEFRERAEDYVCYLGRFTPGKGPFAAMNTARALGIPLRMAGPADEYFREKVASKIDGVAVRHVGAVAGAGRSAFLGGARAMLYPLQAPEPFGLVMIESMMCGTPVAAMRIGATPEVIDEGITGYTATTATEFADAVLRCMELDRHRVRERAVARFSATRMAAEYERVYEQLITEWRQQRFGRTP